MKKESKETAKKIIEDFFKKEEFDSETTKKIKNLAMKHKIRLGTQRKKFCKKCLSQLEGKTRIHKEYKSVRCKHCGFLNRSILDK